MDWATWRKEPGFDSRHYWRKGRDLPTKKGFGQRTQEKQQIRETCRHPNRLNLFDLTTRQGWRSKFLRPTMRFSCSSSVAAALRAALKIDVALERPTRPLLQKIESLATGAARPASSSPLSPLRRGPLGGAT